MEARNDVPRGMNAILLRLESAAKQFLNLSILGLESIREAGSGDIITGGSRFNVKAKSLRLGDFSQDEVREL